ncbi:hypothetical protein BCR39DRAFT_538819 [Naematelia encephala]|uniref:Ion transport domain-containing protein n=1 Tax=Naematelia encephala TaxID=71784 RepID=A0A1Y2AX72_9TREE|nr:hypothetical protein BCR39DRAFT_538819 [Naematelia encephala]
MSAFQRSLVTGSSPPTSIFHLIHDLHTTITQSIDTALTWDQLNTPPINYTLVRPIVSRFVPPSTDKKRSLAGTNGGGQLAVPREDGGESGASGSVSEEVAKGVGLGGILHALMANRIQFITLSAGDLSYAPLQTSRAAFCELLANKLLRSFPHPEDEAELVGQLVRAWCAFEGAPEGVWTSMGDDRKDIEEMRGSALELAIVSQAKHFLSLPLIQHLVNEIYLGHLIYSPISSRSLISDSYVSERTKQRRRHSHSNEARPSKLVEDDESLAEVYVYNPYEAGWLDHQRLRVPKWRKWLEFASFAILLSLFVATLAAKDFGRVNAVEVIFIVFTWGFILEEFAASKEHGWTVYAANAWNAFDMAYIVIFLLYLFLRIFGLASRSPDTSDLAFDILACGACILFPRLVFFLIRDNVIILALKAMIARFISFMALVILCFSGICFCLWTLARGTWTVRQIVWLMLQIWVCDSKVKKLTRFAQFGSSYLGFSSSESFHPIFGPIILISYAALCNVLLITILIALLSNIFADINANAQAEHLFQRVVKTVEGVKSDAVFSYLPPLNILAFIFLVPLSWVLSPRSFHRINVFCIRTTNFPILIAISAYERWRFHHRQGALHLRGPSFERMGLFDSFLGGGSEVLIASVFEVAPPARNGIVTPPKASSLAGSDSDDGETENERGPRPKFDSPLAKLFGKPSVKASPARQLPNREFQSFKTEVESVRESQLRMEEMLGKLLAGSSGS